MRPSPSADRPTSSPGFPTRPAWLLCALLTFDGCVTVSPAQRQVLSQPEMTPATDAQEDSWYGHVETARHGSVSGHGAGAAGGGCGCG